MNTAMDTALDTEESFENSEELEGGHHKGGNPMKKRSRTVAGILALLFGSVGAHKFYQGKYVQGVLFLLFFWTFIPGVLATVEGVHLLGSDEEDNLEEDNLEEDNLEKDNTEADHGRS